MNKLIAILLLTCIFQSCAQNGDNLENSNCIISKEKEDKLLKGYNPILATESTKELSVNFFNNPFSVDSTYRLILIIGNKTIIYRGKFQPYLKTQIPKSVIGKMNGLKFILIGGGKSYIFNTKLITKMRELDDLLQIVFVPKENDWYTFYFNFLKSEDVFEE